jgi:hypothetical protein
MEILLAFLVAVLICAAIGFVAWGIIAILSLVPIPSPFARIIQIVVWVVAGVAMVIVLIRALRGEPLLLMLAA